MRCYTAEAIERLIKKSNDGTPLGCQNEEYLEQQSFVIQAAIADRGQSGIKASSPDKRTSDEMPKHSTVDAHLSQQAIEEFDRHVPDEVFLEALSLKTDITLMDMLAALRSLDIHSEIRASQLTITFRDGIVASWGVFQTGEGVETVGILPCSHSGSMYETIDGEYPVGNILKELYVFLIMVAEASLTR